MADPREVLAGQVQRALSAAFGADYASTDPVIRPSAFADYQSNVALPLARQLGRPPRELAGQIAAQLDLAGVIGRAEVSGPGFINLTLRDDWIAGQATAALADPRVGVPLADPGQKVVVDYSSPNVSKEMHVGHLRTTVVGDAVVRVLEHLGHSVVRANHLGDWGTQFGMLIEYLLAIGEQTALEQLAAGEINAFYQAAQAKFEADPAFADAARQRVTLTDADLAPESFYNPMLADVCAELADDGIAVISDGALVAFPPGFTGRDGAPLPMILRKSDGGYGYDTTDLAAIRYRIRDLKADRLIYLVAAEQSLHFQLLFAVARQAGWLTGEISAEHAVIGLVSGADGKRIRTRSGGQVKLITLIDEAIERAAAVIADRYDDPVLRAEIADAVGIGALKYGDLSVARSSGYVFDFDRMLALTGNTGPYLQYATARIRSIFRRAGLDPATAHGPVLVTEPPERALALALLGFGAAVSQSAAAAEPHQLAGYLFEVASAFTAFYEACPVLKAPDPRLRESRLGLSALTLRVLLTGLGLLGIPVPDRM